MRKRTKKLIFIYSGIAVLFITILCLFIFIGRKKIYTLNYYVNGELYKTVETDTYEPIEVEGIPDDKYFFGWFESTIPCDYPPSLLTRLSEPVKLKYNMDVYAYVAGIDFYETGCIQYIKFTPTEESKIYFSDRDSRNICYSKSININDGIIEFFINKFDYLGYDNQKFIYYESNDGTETKYYEYKDISRFRIIIDTNMNMKVSLLSINNPEISEDMAKVYNYKEKTANIIINYESNDYFIYDAEKIFTKDELVLLDYLLIDYINSFNNFDFSRINYKEYLKTYFDININ